MKQRLAKLAIETITRRNGGDPDYAIALFAASPQALKRLGKAAELLSHREAASLEAAFAAQLVGALAEGCGSCVQIHINTARRAGISDDLIEAVLRGDDQHLTSDAALAVRFSRAIINRTDEEAEAREHVRERWGDKGVVDLTMATQTSRFLSMLKVGFGYATSCERLCVGQNAVEIRRPAA
ncbi:carboxymuconolactone decarboxylase family protein [Phenylobacterium sp. LjRoot225]|uniref:carboxymuconolactone decarboxylase family protein n=1 Tax=Phenylobacterium sp. LjRoot225 TaxID=3342285 RepID=UPI003ECC61AD